MHKICAIFAYITNSSKLRNLYIAFDGVLHLLYYIFAMPNIQKRKAI